MRPPVENAEDEEPAVASLECAGERGGDAADLVVVEGSCAFHCVFTPSKKAYRYRA